MPRPGEASTMIAPKSPSSRGDVARGRVTSWRRPPLDGVGEAASSVIRIDCAAASCSAWASRSAAIQSGLAVWSAMISTSDGPAIMSMPTWPKTGAWRRRHRRCRGRRSWRPGDRLRAIGERGDRLRAADAVDFVDAGDPRRGQHQRVELAVAGTTMTGVGNTHHGDAAARRDLGRHGVHQHRATG
jgi:hypothetical protein